MAVYETNQNDSRDEFRAKIGPNVSNHQNDEQLKFVKSLKRMHIRPHDNRIFQMDFVKFH